MAIDNTITKRLNDWLALKDRTADQVVSGATLLLQLNRNRQLFQTVMTNPKRFEKTVEYELKKFVPIRQRGQTLEDVKNEAAELLGELKPAVAEEPSDNDTKDDADKDLPAHGGKRADHDMLPDNIKAIWGENAARWKRIKQLYNTCLGIEQPCDLAESLNVLKEEWYKYKSEFARYDDYVIADNANPDETAEKQTSAKDITNARSYLSKMVKDDKLLNMKKASLADDADEKAISSYNTALANTQKRVQLLVDSGEEIGDDLKAKLTDAGVVFPSEQPSETVDSTDDNGVEDEQGQEG